MTKIKEVLTREKAPTLQDTGVEPVIDEAALREAARILGAMGGRATKGISTPKKRRASRANGKLGGRPRKQAKR